MDWFRNHLQLLLIEYLLNSVPDTAGEGETMSAKILLFGKDAWPYTRAAREAFAREGRQVEYFNVVKEPKHMDSMLKHSKGARKVPVIVEGEAVTIGFEGRTWGIWSFGWKPKGMSNVDWQMKNEGILPF